MTPINQINLMIFNAQSICNKKIEFFEFLLLKSIDIALISETHLNNNITCSHSEYSSYRLDRSDGRKSGGVAIFVRRGIKHSLLPCPQTRVVEALSIEIYSGNKSFRISSIYFPGSSDLHILRHFRRDLDLICKGPNFLIGGDFNARHWSWNCARNNAAGVLLEQHVANDNLLIHYPDTHTLFPHCGSSPSTIDLMVSRGFPFPSQISTDHSFKSDHLPVLCSLNLNAERFFVPERTVKDFSRANWELFAEFINSRMPDMMSDLVSPDTDSNTIDRLLTEFVEIVLEADTSFIPVKPIVTHPTSLPLDIRALISLRRAKNRNFRRTGDVRMKLEAKLLTERIEVRIREHTNSMFEHAIEKIDQNPGPYRKKFWRITRFMKNRPKALPVLKKGNQLLVTDQEKCEAFADHFEAVHDATDNILRNDVTSKRIKTSLKQIGDSHTDPQSVPVITFMTIVSILITLKNNKAPGPDQANNRHLKHLPVSALEFLAEIFNICLRIGYFPKDWKKSKVSFILKPGKAASDISGYRPISLLSNISKIFERIILAHLNDFITENDIILPHQYGFRPGKSCSHQLFRITRHVRKQIDAKKSVGMLSIDLKSAFDAIWHDALLHKLLKMRLPLFLIKIVKSFLSDRCLQVSSGKVLSSPRHVRAGVPQGAVLSPTLFNLFLHDIVMNFEALLAQFADDTALLATSHSTEALTKKLEKAAAKLTKYFKTWRIRVNGLKSEALLFTKKTALRHKPRRKLKVDGAKVAWGDSLKYLGMVLDKRLTYGKHVDYLISKSEKLIKALYPLINRNSRLSVNNKILLLKTIFRPTFSYASPVWSGCATIHRKKLQVFQNRVLKIMLNRPRLTPTHEIHQIAGIELVQEYLDKLNLSFLTNCHSNINPDIRELFS